MRLRRVVLITVIGCLSAVSYATGASAAGRRHGHAEPTGSTLLRKAENNSICEQALDRYPAYAHNDDLGGPQLFAGGLFLMGCNQEKLFGNPRMIVAFDVLDHQIRWTKWINTGGHYVISHHHVFRLFSKVTPAHGLKGKITSRYLSAYSIATGRLQWTSPYPDPDPAADEIGEPVEGPTGGTGSTEQVVLPYLGTSAFDAATGEFLWSTPAPFYSEASGSYVGSDTAVIFGRESYASDEATGIDPVTGDVKWEIHLPEECPTESDETVGSIEWEYGEHCILAYDLVTGQIIFNVWLPSSWERVAADANGVLEWGQGQLAYYSLANLTTPVWSKPASATDPVIVGSGHAIDKAQAGTFIIDLANGKIVKKVSWWSGSEVEGPIGGLLAMTVPGSTSSIMRLDGR
jgi:outer membrane protein assembly factor BamB